MPSDPAGGHTSKEPHRCAHGSTVQATLLVRSTRDFESPDTEDPDPTARVQFLAVCADGTSFSWAAPTAPATITSANDLKSITAAGAGMARDNLARFESRPRGHPGIYGVNPWHACR
jgi:hypothetical protein